MSNTRVHLVVIDRQTMNTVVARCGRGKWPGRAIRLSSELADVTCEACLNLARTRTWSPVGNHGGPVPGSAAARRRGVPDPVEDAVRREWERTHPPSGRSAGTKLLERAMEREVERLDG